MNYAVWGMMLSLIGIDYLIYSHMVGNGKYSLTALAGLGFVFVGIVIVCISTYKDARKYFDI